MRDFLNFLLLAVCFLLIGAILTATVVLNTEYPDLADFRRSLNIHDNGEPEPSAAPIPRETVKPAVEPLPVPATPKRQSTTTDGREARTLYVDPHLWEQFVVQCQTKGYTSGQCFQALVSARR